VHIWKLKFQAFTVSKHFRKTFDHFFKFVITKDLEFSWSSFIQISVLDRLYLKKLIITFLVLLKAIKYLTAVTAARIFSVFLVHVYSILVDYTNFVYFLYEMQTLLKAFPQLWKCKDLHVIANLAWSQPISFLYPGCYFVLKIVIYEYFSIRSEVTLMSEMKIHTCTHLFGFSGNLFSKEIV